MLKIQDFQDIWKVSLIVLGLYLILLGYLACRSGYVPRLLGVLLVIADGGYLIDSAAASRLVDEALRMSEHPGIVFRPAGVR